MELPIQYAVAIRLKHGSSSRLSDGQLGQLVGTLLEHYLLGWPGRRFGTVPSLREPGVRRSQTEFMKAFQNLVRYFPTEISVNSTLDTQKKRWWDMVIQPIIRDLQAKKYPLHSDLGTPRFKVTLQPPNEQELATMMTEYVSVVSRPLAVSVV